eukprot:c32795_g1_i1 orf=258-1730(+)
MQLQVLCSFIGGAYLSSYWALVAAVTIPSFITCLLLLIFRKGAGARPRHHLLPLGSQGWLPIVGETLEYARPNQSLLFMQRRVHKYGELFQSHLFGDPIIVSCSPKINHFICQHEYKLFRSSYPRSFISILGENNVLALPKELHKKVRGALLSTFASSLRNKDYIKDVSTTIGRTLKQWDGKVICAQEELAKMAYVVAAKKLLGLHEHDWECQILQTLYFELIKGLISIPINFPGMAYHKSMRARAKIEKIIDDMIAKRKAHPKPISQESDFMDALIKEEEKSDTFITREVTRDSILSVLFAGHDTVSKAMACAVKYLLDNPRVMEMLKEEQLRIQDHVKEGEDLTWEDYKSMTFSNNVVSEILRLTNIAPCVFRDALEDVDIDGLRIPKGRKVMAYFSLNHLEPNKFQDPFQFNPWRWEDKSLSDTNFMPFGGGPRLCPGNDFAKLQICIFLHHLVLKHRFKQIEEDEIVYSPYIHFKRGLPTFFENVE